MSWFVNVIRFGVDEPTPERQSAVRDHVGHLTADEIDYVADVLERPLEEAGWA